MKKSQEKQYKIEGTVAPGYESVKRMFEDNFVSGSDEKSQLCVYVGDRLVVDIWGHSLTQEDNYNADTLTNVFSSTKSLTAICLAMMVDQGLLQYNDKITQHWPEYAIKDSDKADTTIADLMRHEAGLAAFDTSINPSDVQIEDIKNNAVGAVIEKQTMHFPATGRRQYHAVTRGWVANEVFRRVHPLGLTIGEFLSANINTTLDARVFIGCDDPNYCPVKSMSVPFIVGQSFIPKKLGRTIDQNFLDLCLMMNGFRKIRKDGKDKPPAIVGLDLTGKIWNTPQIRKGEIPSANGNCSARGLAKVAAMMANKGTFEGKTLLSPQTWEEMHLNPTDGILVQKSVKFTQGGVAKFEEEGSGDGCCGRNGFYGWMGFGGSVFQWHPELKIGFAYVPTLLNWVDLVNNKARLLQEEVVKCVTRDINNTVIVQ